jgi:hypothetical protein
VLLPGAAAVELHAQSPAAARTETARVAARRTRAEVRSTRGLRPGAPPTNPQADDIAAGEAQAEGMTPLDYIINIGLVAMVLLQIRDRRMDLRSLLLPVVTVAAAAAFYLKGVPTSGNDVLLDAVLGAAGLVLGVACALTTRVWRAVDGLAHSKAGVAAAVLWIVGVGSRLAFELYSTHGGSGSIARFSASHAITSSEAWVAALVIMALAEVVSRLVVLRVKGALAAPAPAPAPTPALSTSNAAA